MAVPTANKIYVDTLNSPSWVPQGDGTLRMSLGDGFATLDSKNKRMYAERVISPDGAMDLANITGMPALDEGRDVVVKYSSKDSTLAFETRSGEGVYVLDGKNPKTRELYASTLNYLFQNDALIGLAGGETAPISGSPGGHGTLYKAGVVAFTLLTALGISGCVSSGDTAKEKVTDTYKSAEVKATDAPAQITDSHVKERTLGGYDIVGSKEAPGVKLTTPPQKPEKAILDDGVIDTGNMDDISLALSEDEKIVSIYANAAAFKNNGGDILLHPMVEGEGSSNDRVVSIDEFVVVAPGLYRYDLNIQEIKAKYDLPSGTEVRVLSVELFKETKAARERGGFAMAQFVID